MKHLKRFFIAFIILLILSGGAVFVIITFYKKELTGLLAENLKTSYGLDLSVEDVRVSFFSNWPHTSIKLEQVRLANTLRSAEESPLLKAGAISLSVNLKKLLKGEFVVRQVSLRDAEINLLRTPDGSKNFEFRKPEKDSTRKSSVNFEISRISLHDVYFNFLNQERNQDISLRFMDVALRLSQYEDGLKARLKGSTLVRQLLFNERNGAFLKNARTMLDLDLNYLYETRTLCIYGPSKVEIEGHPYAVTSLVQLGEPRKLSLRVESEKLKLERVATLMTPRIHKVLSNFEVRRPIDASLLLVASLGQREEPVILAEVTGRDCDLTIGKSRIPYSGLDFHGKIRSLDTSGRCGNIEQASIVFRKIKGKVYDFPFTADVNVNNLARPDISIQASLQIEARKIPYELAKDFVLNGSASARLSYSGPASRLNKKEFLQPPMVLAADIQFNRLSYKELNRPYVYTVNGRATLNNQDLEFGNLDVKTNIARASVKGKASGFVPYLFGLSKGFKATVSAQTDLLDLNPLFAENDAGKKQPASSGQDKAGNKKISQSQFEFDVNLSAKKLIVRKVEATQAAVELFYKDNSLSIRSASLYTCGGKIKAKASVRDFNRLDADVSVQQVNVRTLFRQFENFGQEAIVSENLEGDISIDALFRSDLDDRLNLRPESMFCNAKLKLVNGHIINYEPIQNLSNFLFKNRDFNDVSFSELNETFKLRGYEMQIDELEIGSNLLNLYVVNGIYHFKGHSNVNILIPWNNLKKRGKDYIPKSSGENAENTKGLKLNFNGPSRKMKISLGHREQEKKFF